MVRPALLCGAETWATRRGQEARLEVNEMRMLRWMRDKIRNEHIRGETRMMQVSKKITEKLLKWYGHVRKLKEEHMVAHGEKNARCGHTRGKKKRAAKPKMRTREI